jgi:hypothetical protein
MSSQLFKGVGATAIPRYWETMGGRAVFCREMPDRPCPAPPNRCNWRAAYGPGPATARPGKAVWPGPALRGGSTPDPMIALAKPRRWRDGNVVRGPLLTPLVAQCTAASPPLLRSWHTRLARPGGGRGRARRWGENGARKKSGARTFVSRKLPRPLMLTGLGSDHWRSNLGPKRSY